MVHLCSNDYLGLSQNNIVLKETMKELHVISPCSSRLISGTHPRVIELEKLLASHRKTESALVFPTGYSANLGVVSAIADKKTTIFSDELNHASIIDACKLSGAKTMVFRHNDTDHLRNLMQIVRGRKILITEGIFSMDGDLGNLCELNRVANEHDALTIVDDAHGDFIFGPCFSGVPAKFGVDVDIHVSSMSKGLGCFGGYVATSSSIRELLINSSRQFIYTSALPVHLCSASIAAIPIAKKGYLQRSLSRNIAYFGNAMKRRGFELLSPLSQIIPLLVGQERQAVEFSKELMREGVFAQAIRYPTVKKGHARLRITLTALHRQKHLDMAVDAFETAARKTDIL
jgi:glycine C-acetyltransferase